MDAMAGVVEQWLREDREGPKKQRHTAHTFVEPIEVWEKFRLLRFSVTGQAPPLQELSPYGEDSGLIYPMLNRCPEELFHFYSL